MVFIAAVFTLPYFPNNSSAIISILFSYKLLPNIRNKQKVNIFLINL